MQRGSSGATFTFLGDRVVKRGDTDRITDQGMWLQKHQSPSVPKVFQAYARSYVMERLIAPPFWALDHRIVLDHMFGTLKADVWSQPAEVKLDYEAMITKYAKLCTNFAVSETLNDLVRLCERIIWNDLKQCLTHGDPTFDNVMFRDTEYGGDLVIADPIPATPAVPDLMCVDLGKILQSALGWEEVRYGSRAFRFRAGTMDVLDRVTDKNERRATVFWSAVHILRAFPYVTDDVRRKLKERLNAAVRLGL